MLDVADEIIDICAQAVKDSEDQKRSRTHTVDDPSVLDLDSPSTLDLHSALDSHPTEQNVSNLTEHDLITLCAILTIRQEVLDQREHAEGCWAL